MFKLSPMSIRFKRGMTLVELMIVVAVIGVLASIASVSYVKYVKQAKITKLKQYAMDVSRGQEQYRARHNVYYPRAGGSFTLTDATTAADKNIWSQILEFNHALEAGITVETESGIGGACGICEGIDPTVTEGTTDLAWYAVRVSQPLNPANNGLAADKVTAIILTSDQLQPVVLREGQ